MANPWWVRQKNDVVAKAIAVVEPLVAAEGCELCDAELAFGHRPTLRFFIDRAGRLENGGWDNVATGITLDQLTALNRLIGDALDVANPIENAYHLEVGSPGLDRPLAREQDFLAAVGRVVNVKTHEKINGRARFKGTLKAASAAALVIVDGPLEMTVPVARVARARLEYTLPEAEPAAHKRGKATGPKKSTDRSRQAG